MKKTVVALAASLVLSAACKDALNAPSQDNLVAGTAQPIQNLVTGIVATDRASAMVFGYLLYPETEARNSVRVDPNEPRFVSELIAVKIDASDFIGASTWTGFFQAIRSANQFLTTPSLNGLTAGDKAAAIGFVQTMKALEYIRVIQVRDTLGVPIQTAAVSTPDPIRTKTSVLAFISALLDSANASLQAGSAKMPFALPAGFKVNGDYTQAANLILFNRALKGMVEVYRGLDHQSPCAACFATAKAALTTALGTAAPTATNLQMGPYYQFNPAAPESFGNPLTDNHIYLSDNFANSIQAGDLRASKITTASSPSATQNGLTLTKRDPITDASNLSNLTRNIPIIRNAALYLLRAQAEAESGDLVSATADVNVVHTIEGGLAPYGATFADLTTARNAILYEMRYSLIYEGPYHLIALRQYGLVTKAYVSQAGMPTVSTDPSHSSDPLQTTLPIPANEAAARNGNVTPVP